MNDNMWIAKTPSYIVSPDGLHYILDAEPVGEILVAHLNLMRRQSLNTVKELQDKISKLKSGLAQINPKHYLLNI